MSRIHPGYRKMKELWDFLDRKLPARKSTPSLFNQYGDSNSFLDLPMSSVYRMDNLRDFIMSLDHPDTLILGEAAGPRGCRFSGIPFTSEKQLVDGLLPFPGRRTSKDVGGPFSEVSGRLFWEVMRLYYGSFMVWNTVPYHPHEPGWPLSIRTPTKRERKDCTEFVYGINNILVPRKRIAIGRLAMEDFKLMGMNATQVRHPSHGGARLFKEQMGRALA